MKISLIGSVLLTCLLVQSAFSQTNTRNKPKKQLPKRSSTQKRKVVPVRKAVPKQAVTSVAVAAPKQDEAKTSFDKFYERLGILYIGFFTSPPLEDFDSRRAAISPQWEGSCDNCDSYSMNLYNQFNFSYNFGAKMKFNIIPRFTLFFDEAPDQAPGERSTFMMEDWLISFSGTVFSSEDKKFNWWMRPGVRLPTSHFARHGADNAQFGQYNYQLEWLQALTYQLTPTVEVGVTLQERVWIYENRYNWSRHRHLTSPHVLVKAHDKLDVRIAYENMVENTRNWKSINGKEPNYKDVWQNVAVTFEAKVTDRLTISPAINAYVDDLPFGTKSFWVSSVLVYAIK